MSTTGSTTPRGTSISGSKDADGLGLVSPPRIERPLPVVLRPSGTPPSLVTSRREIRISHFFFKSLSDQCITSISRKSPIGLTSLKKPRSLVTAISYRGTVFADHCTVLLRSSARLLLFDNRILVARGALPPSEDTLPAYRCTGAVVCHKCSPFLDLTPCGRNIRGRLKL